MDTSDWSGVNSTKPFQLVRADLADAPHFCSNQSSTALRWPAGSMAAGPLYNCSYGACTSGINDSSCKASTTLNGVTGIASLNSKHGTHWAHQVCVCLCVCARDVGAVPICRTNPCCALPNRVRHLSPVWAAAHF